MYMKNTKERQYKYGEEYEKGNDASI